MTYLECKQFHMDRLCSQGNMCSIPCDLWASSRQILHIGRDQHTFHFHISELLDSQDLSSTHMACTDHMDCRCGWAYRCKWTCGPSHCTQHFVHTVHRGKDPGILDQNRPQSEDIHHLIDIQLWEKGIHKKSVLIKGMVKGNLTFSADCKRVPNKASPACTSCPVTADTTFGIDSTC